MISKEAWFHIISDKKSRADIRRVFREWGIKVKIPCDKTKKTWRRDLMDDPEVYLPLKFEDEKQMQKLKSRFRQVQDDLKRLNWKLLRWRIDGDKDIFALQKLHPKSYDTLYHVTESANVPSIFKQGLLPHSNRTYLLNSPQGVYLMTEKNLGTAKNFARELKYEKGMTGRWIEFSLLEITVPEGLPIFLDPEHFGTSHAGEAVYATKRIPPQYIRVDSVFSV